MSIGVFIGIASSFIDSADARSFLDAINRALQAEGLPEYEEPAPVPDVYRAGRFGRSELDHHGASTLMALAGLAEETGLSEHISLIGESPYRVAFLPIKFAHPLATEYAEPTGALPRRISVGSLYFLERELRVLAPTLGILLEGTKLADHTAQAINEGEDADNDEFTVPLVEERSAWLLLFEGVRLALSHQIALSLAG